MAYRFNNARGGVTCDECNILFDEDLGHDEYVKAYQTPKKPDLCWRCKAKPKATRRRRAANALTRPRGPTGRASVF
jgi:hypothetical protein